MTYHLHAMKDLGPKEISGYRKWIRNEVDSIDGIIKEVFFWILKMTENEPEKLLDWTEFVPQTSVYLQLQILRTFLEIKT